jgi:hypothetical protein
MKIQIFLEIIFVINYNFFERINRGKIMKTKMVILIMVFWLFSSSSLNAQIIGIEWNTFFGSNSWDYGNGITVDNSGNIYVTGHSDTSWGSPINTHSGDYDVFVACLDNSGNMLWHTFLGSSDGDFGRGIILDSSGNVYVVGDSDASWGSPVSDYAGSRDIFVACLDSSGNLLWNGFYGSASAEWGEAIVLDSSGNIYVAGLGYGIWGNPINAYSGGGDIIVACLNSSGNRLWNTFLGSSNEDECKGMALDSSGNVYVAGMSDATWGSPKNAYSGDYDGVVACLNSSGNLLWNTFLGSTDTDYFWDVSLDSSGNVYVTGNSNATWGSPINTHSGGDDVVVARLDSSGNLLWNTFLGSLTYDIGSGIELDNSGNIFVSGRSGATWGSPINTYSGGSGDALVACLNSSGNLLWNTFLGSAAGYAESHSITMDSMANIYVTGISNASWGSPLNAYNGLWDVFVTKMTPEPIPDTMANGSDGPISITQSDSLKIKVSLISYGLTDEVDYWLAYKGPSGWVHYDFSAKKWLAGLDVTYQGALMDLNNKKVFQSSGLTPGNYTFYFGVDMSMDGKVTKSSLYKDEVKVTVTQ